MAPAAAARDAPAWNGPYEVTFHADQKNGTSVAAHQPEKTYTSRYVFNTDCPADGCVAKIVDGPRSKNMGMDQPMEFSWNGNQWEQSSDWKWDCRRADGSVAWSPARSDVNYMPKPDGSLSGIFHTQILSGECRGSIDIPVSAAPAS